MKLLRLKLENFKGVRDLDIVAPGGGDITIRGDNGTGKTTVADALMWLLFGKDSLGRAAFEIKTIDPDTCETLHGLDHSVEARLDTGEAEVTLKRVYAENWTKRRGEQDRLLTGHSTTYFVDEVPRKKKEYDATIEGLIPEESFRLLTDPLEFAERLPWKERRALLMEVCGDVTIGDVVEANPDLKKIREVLGTHTVEDKRKIIAATKAKINKEIEKIPTRIDEANRSMPVAEDAPFGSVQQMRSAWEAISTHEHRRAEAERRLAEGEEAARHDQAREFREAKAKADELRLASQSERHEMRAALHDAKLRKGQELAVARADLGQAVNDVANVSQAISTAEFDQATLREEWRKVDARMPEFEQATVCPTCEQPIPEADLENARATAMRRFNAAKAEDLESIDSEGRELTVQIEEGKAALERAEAKADGTKARVDELESEMAAAVEEFDLFDGTLEFKLPEALAQQIEELAAQLAEPYDDSEITTEIAKETRLIEEGQKSAMWLERMDEVRKRKAELGSEERRLAGELEELEGELYVCETFIRKKVDMLESRINDAFGLARFRLFKTQVNGAVDECCDVTLSGVPYSSGLNHSARVAVGLDVIKTLQTYFDASPPVIVDQAESFTSLPEMDCQIIKLIVSAGHMVLKVEVEE